MSSQRRRNYEYAYHGLDQKPSTWQALMNMTQSPIFLGGMVVFSVFMFTTDAKALFGTPFLGQGDDHYKGELPNSLLTVDYPYTLLRDVVLDQPVDLEDIPFIWHPHRSDERIVQSVFSQCYGVDIIELDSIESIKKAIDVNLASRRAERFAITSPFLHEAAEIFSVENMGRMSCFFRHPLDYDLHNNLPTKKYEKDDNWLVRYMIREPSIEMGYKQLGLAKQIMRKTCVVGTIEKMSESMKRVAAYYGWELTGSERCVDDIVDRENPQEKFIDHTSRTWDAFYGNNMYDCQLYELAQSQWRGQIQTIIPYRLQIARERGVSGEVDEEAEEEAEEEEAEEGEADEGAEPKRRLGRI